MNMREKIARAIYEKRNGTGCNPWARLPAAHQSPYLIDAAALDALMEPTDGMKLAGGFKYEAMCFEGDGSFTGVIFTDMGTIFTSMTQAARDGA